MSEQKALFNKTETAFEKFHAANPQVYQMFIALAREAKNKGYKRFSAEIIFNVIRWKTILKATSTVRTTEGEKAIKLDNNHKAFYSRKLMKEFPEFDKFFETRKSNADLEVL